MADDHNDDTPSISVKTAIVIGWLNHLKGIAFVMQKDEEIIAIMQARLDLSALAYDSIGGGGASDMADKIADLVDLKRELTLRHADEVRELEDGRRICHVPDDLPRAMLWEHYVEGKSWHDVGVDHKLAGSYVPAKARGGISGIYENMPEEFREIPEAL